LLVPPSSGSTSVARSVAGLPLMQLPHPQVMGGKRVMRQTSMITTEFQCCAFVFSFSYWNFFSWSPRPAPGFLAILETTNLQPNIICILSSPFMMCPISPMLPTLPDHSALFMTIYASQTTRLFRFRQCSLYDMGRYQYEINMCLQNDFHCKLDSSYSCLHNRWRSGIFDPK